MHPAQSPALTDEILEDCLQAVHRLEFQKPVLQPEHHRPHLGGFIFQREVKVARAGEAKV